eukprot:Selendium_serpulae@DN2899_c0_g1_i1.p1
MSCIAAQSPSIRGAARRPRSTAEAPLVAPHSWHKQLTRPDLHRREPGNDSAPRDDTACGDRPVAPPTTGQLGAHFINSAVPMYGFGLMDNLIMIQAGELIDLSLGVTFGLSTLTAAAVGQIFSDVSGVCFGRAVESFAAQLGLPTPDFTHAQRELPTVRSFGTAGHCVGIILGCLTGMLSLLFMDLEKTEVKKRQALLSPIFLTIAHQAERMINCSCNIFLVDFDKNLLYDVTLTPASSGRPIRLDGDPDEELVHIAAYVAKHARPVNLRDVATRMCDRGVIPVKASDVRFEEDDDDEEEGCRNGCNKKRVSSHALSPTAPRGEEAIKRVVVPDHIAHSVLCYPVFDTNKESQLIGVVLLGDKRRSRRAKRLSQSEVASSEFQPFRRTDEKLVKMLCEHFSLYIALAATSVKNETGLDFPEDGSWVCPDDSTALLRFSSLEVPTEVPIPADTLLPLPPRSTLPVRLTTVLQLARVQLAAPLPTTLASAKVAASPQRSAADGSVGGAKRSGLRDIVSPLWWTTP